MHAVQDGNRLIQPSELISMQAGRALLTRSSIAKKGRAQFVSRLMEACSPRGVGRKAARPHAGRAWSGRIRTPRRTPRSRGVRHALPRPRASQGRGWGEPEESLTLAKIAPCGCLVALLQLWRFLADLGRGVAQFDHLDVTDKIERQYTFIGCC